MVVMGMREEEGENSGIKGLGNNFKKARTSKLFFVWGYAYKISIWGDIWFEILNLDWEITPLPHQRKTFCFKMFLGDRFFYFWGKLVRQLIYFTLSLRYWMSLSVFIQESRGKT